MSTLNVIPLKLIFFKIKNKRRKNKKKKNKPDYCQIALAKNYQRDSAGLKRATDCDVRQEFKL